ncbi:uncharacterized protein LOC106877745 isoform X2 [Octopus bimaculoides]|uniref:uncharacterized protein LOC106877745 isoform X2 n=1 Tax=Octopus bimaculoides TaxID=37653 RepID=UPI00071E1B32|nr:uncharacterized protein LOC106877745 isoform X2 [Octopus bimaculoides]|eukprot:XP_014782241.1 PREDICTED: uncharacterized protein LOC106877745 isoform X2 [Octopus bimaculoides]
MEFTVTKRGGRKLLYNGYAYTVDKKKNNITYWKCEERRKCVARLKTIDDVLQYDPPPHSHPQDACRNVVLKTIQQITAGANDTEVTSTIIENCTPALPQETASSLSLKENPNRKRRKMEIFQTHKAGSSNKNLYLNKKKQPPSSPATVLISDSNHPPSPPAKIPKRQAFLKEFQEENLKIKKNCQENDFTDRQNIGHISKIAENSQEPSIKNLICVVEESENMPDPVRFSTFQVPIPTTQPQAIEIPQPQGKKIFILADHQKNVMSSLALLWKSGKLCDASIDNGSSTVMVHKVVLFAVCPKLLSVFGAEMLSQNFLHINLPQEVSTKALDAFADYMYNGILDLDPNILHQLKIIAKRLEMKDFEQLCDSQLPNTTHQQPITTTNAFVASNPMTGNVSVSQNVTTPNQLSPCFSSISSNFLSTNTTLSSGINDKISRAELLPKENRVTLFGNNSKVALLDTIDINSSGNFVMAPTVKNEPMEPEESRYEHSKFYSSIPISNGSRTRSTMLNCKDASTSEFVLPLLDTTHSKAITNVMRGTSSKLKSNTFESSLHSNLEFALRTEKNMCFQSNPIRENPSKPQNQTITIQSFDNMVTSSGNKSVYPAGHFTVGRNRKQLSSVQLPV